MYEAGMITVFPMIGKRVFPVNVEYEVDEDEKDMIFISAKLAEADYINVKIDYLHRCLFTDWLTPSRVDMLIHMVCEELDERQGLPPEQSWVTAFLERWVAA